MDVLEKTEEEIKALEAEYAKKNGGPLIHISFGTDHRSAAAMLASPMLLMRTLLPPIIQAFRYSLSERPDRDAICREVGLDPADLFDDSGEPDVSPADAEGPALARIAQRGLH
jgi:hypothetical protein